MKMNKKETAQCNGKRKGIIIDYRKSQQDRVLSKNEDLLPKVAFWGPEFQNRENPRMEGTEKCGDGV
jgi:hypothetical protein